MEDETIADAIALGLPDDAVAHLSDTGDQGVWPENVPLVEAFLSVATQWRTATRFAGEIGSIRYLGLDYAAAKIGLDCAGIAVTPELWRAVAIMEAAAANALNEG